MGCVGSVRPKRVLAGAMDVSWSEGRLAAAICAITGWRLLLGEKPLVVLVAAAFLHHGARLLAFASWVAVLNKYYDNTSIR